MGQGKEEGPKCEIIWLSGSHSILGVLLPAGARAAENVAEYLKAGWEIQVAWKNDKAGSVIPQKGSRAVQCITTALDESEQMVT